MKNFILTALVLSTMTSTVAMAKGSIETYISKCSKKSAYLNPETNLPETSISNFVIESKSFISHDKTEETEIYKYLASSTDGEEFDVTNENGNSKITYTKVSDTEERIIVIDNYEFVSSSDENGNEVFEKDSVTTDSLWKTLEKTDNKVVSLRVSQLSNGKEVKEQILKTKIIKSDSEWTLDTMTLNPQDVKRGDRQLLFSVKSCEVTKK